MYFVGLDIHWRTTTCCILDDNGKTIKSTHIRGPWSDVVAFLKTIEQPFEVCYEASCGYGHLHDQFAQIARRVAVAHPGQLRMIFRSKRKHDRVDAQKLAKLLYLDEVPQVHVPTTDVRQWRMLIQWRRKLMDKRVSVKNALRALLRSHGIAAASGHGLWTSKGKAWLAQVALPMIAALQRDMLLDELAQHHRQIQRVTAQLNAMAADHPGVALLRTIPGVGPRTAEAIVAFIDRPDRFGKIKQAGTYFGLVPCEDSSADHQRLGHITKEGPGTARKLLIEAAWQGIRRSPTIRAFYERVCKEDPDRRKISLVATARWLVCVMLSMLKSGQVWAHPQEKEHKPQKLEKVEKTTVKRSRRKTTHKSMTAVTQTTKDTTMTAAEQAA